MLQGVGKCGAARGAGGRFQALSAVVGNVDTRDVRRMSCCVQKAAQWAVQASAFSLSP